MKLIPMQGQVLDGTPLIQACCRDARGQPYTGRPDMIGDAYRYRRSHRAPRAQRIGIACGLWGRERFVPPLAWKHQRVSSQRYPPQRVCPPARSALWHGASFLLPRCARRSRKSSGRHPSCRTRFRSARPHDTPIPPSFAIGLRFTVAATMLHHTPCFAGLPVALTMLVKAVQRFPVKQHHHGS